MANVHNYNIVLQSKLRRATGRKRRVPLQPEVTIHNRNVPVLTVHVVTKLLYQYGSCFTDFSTVFLESGSVLLLIIPKDEKSSSWPKNCVRRKRSDKAYFFGMDLTVL
ncbi:hypothetical protein ElyMa_005727300 [Elysia marginata]|uniref:Uncharacterized protein n=1 Tax=Elysia marginata TaxID=1093978 RepID=A0AAV4FJ71_9GAST|nr:hypothetical protein ElyMa_005727300 [Elysia marginata]